MNFNSCPPTCCPPPCLPPPPSCPPPCCPPMRATMVCPPRAPPPQNCAQSFQPPVLRPACCPPPPCCNPCVPRPCSQMNNSNKCPNQCTLSVCSDSNARQGAHPMLCCGQETCQKPCPQTVSLVRTSQDALQSEWIIVVTYVLKKPRYYSPDESLVGTKHVSSLSKRILFFSLLRTALPGLVFSYINATATYYKV
ncbi:hypothetical protein HELRODRAFT_166127 [Helobdella robusta]|uniref:Uncharacterized protein n=1 Tax=Helobdella robusta TaxID=6412 RepID=T1EXT7_HELRO|nr:hypothetical protein HELRODRAFT_166127 [Helobdella robusta]ESN90460.1 hypothetical protein HELRODRAFT_166127 [Helobdella robusta]